MNRRNQLCLITMYLLQSVGCTHNVDHRNADQPCLSAGEFHIAAAFHAQEEKTFGEYKTLRGELLITIVNMSSSSIAVGMKDARVRVVNLDNGNWSEDDETAGWLQASKDVHLRAGGRAQLRRSTTMAVKANANLEFYVMGYTVAPVPHPMEH